MELWIWRSKLRVWSQRLFSDRDIRTLFWVILVTSTFHCVAPVRQGLEWYYGKGYPDYFSYVQLAEFLKEEPYGTDLKQIGLRPWMVNSAVWLKKQRIGQSIVTAEISVWSGTDAKRGYPATIIFFLSVLGVCVHTFLRVIGADRFVSGCGAILAGVLPVITRLSLDAFLSQISVLFIFPFMACLLKGVDLRARSFTVLFSLTFAYLISAYSELAPLGLGTLFLGVLFVRQDPWRTKRIMIMLTVLLTVAMNVHYVGDLIEFLGT